MNPTPVNRVGCGRHATLTILVRKAGRKIVRLISKELECPGQVSPKGCRCLYEPPKR